MTRNVFKSTTGLSEASNTFDQMYPAMKSTLSELDQLFGLLLADFRFEAVVFVNYLDRQAAHFASHVVERELE